MTRLPRADARVRAVLWTLQWAASASGTGLSDTGCSVFRTTGTPYSILICALNSFDNGVQLTMGMVSLEILILRLKGLPTMIRWCRKVAGAVLSAALIMIGVHAADRPPSAAVTAGHKGICQPVRRARFGQAPASNALDTEANARPGLYRSRVRNDNQACDQCAVRRGDQTFILP